MCVCYNYLMAYIPRRRRAKKRFLFFQIPRFNKQSFLLYFVLGIFIMIVFGYLSAIVLFAWYGRDLPKPGKLSETRENSTVYYDRNDEVIYEMYEDKNRLPIASEDIPEVLKQSTVAIEDKRFYEHKGISEFGIIRAGINSLLGKPQGGSTITQQLIKNVLLTSERRISRKIKEAILAYQVEKQYNKDEILTMYLNEAPYGGSYWGVGSAAKGYFDKEPKDISLVEAAFLAGLPQQPSVYSPFVNEKNAWKARTEDVLRRMREDKYIDRDIEEKALTQLEKLKFSQQKFNITAPHFVFYIKDQIEKEFGSGILNKGVKIKTTLDLKLQQKAEQIVKDEIEVLDKYAVGNGALVAIAPDTGEIITYVGSYDFSNDEYGKFDVVSQGNRQPGSTLKPIEYAVALKKGYTASTVIMDIKTVFPNVVDEDYVPVNYDGKYRGPVQLRFALGNSLNVPAVKLLAMVGIRDFLQQAYEMGLDSLEPTDKNISNLGLSASLGGGETTLLDLTQAFAVFANEGKIVEPYGIIEITDFDNKKIYEHKESKSKQVLSKEISFIISNILSDNNARIDTFGANSYLRIPGKTVAVKSGTTDDKRDNWAVGFSHEIALGVWVGNNDNSPMNKNIASGATGASPIWHDTMQVLLSEFEDGIMEKPDSVEELEVDAYLGGLPKEGYPTRTEYFIKDTSPHEVSPYYKVLQISKETGKLANDVEIRSGNYEEKEFIVIMESDPISGNGKNRWQEAIDEWANAQEDSKYHYPTETSNARLEDVVISIKNPENEKRIDSNSVEVYAKITSIEMISEVKIYIDNKEKKNFSGDRDEIRETFEIENGKHTIKVEARNEKDKVSSSEVTISVNEDYNN
ncbi:MAG: Penicillin-binding protein, 1A family [Candidatus Roizmanbacteria bacterium GW2011_GWA2_37_7]|uniref:Penicillin-binding protein, 1A family n=1 Tax=Candidatus Roizmanbacteria bacterium GW2011_GWA2_37_7 TaxID=1618481 RepID=A0A0G0H9E0_9BACT|nr:MAG: Penicillin-binding protein, 1A family [Candidatus Roizmanbacteria bacterium GW2011_GWA2_37_7]